ncbi:response regulator transcription factor [Gracilibacillus alcaliphilus]|uniref:response regulator transcription factor n=1 Tax=Gracilibacillus alcaliphilus TaxID=1401441 RepID=UPI001958B5BF|nr:response regulator transcription factor [Gracilibacillus alcaliphilus]MBM7677057.1 two-component system response regulator YesN [Gracilibacillus alcaliphilus]
MNRIVLVDDEQFVRQGIMTLIDWSKINYQVVGEASNGEDAVEIILKQEPDVVLTDIRMPVFDGLKLIQQVKKQASKVPKFIIISGYSDFEYAQQAVRLGVTDFILKPIDKQELETVLLDLTTIMAQAKIQEQVSQRFVNYHLYQRIIINGEPPTPQELIKITRSENKFNCYLIIDTGDHKENDMIDESIMKVLIDFFEDENIFFHPIEKEGFGVLLEEKHLPNHFDQLSWLLERLRNYITQQLDKRIFIFAGKLGQSLEGIRYSYRTAMIASARRYVQLDQSTLIYDENLERLSQLNKPLNYHIIRKLIENIEENKKEEIEKQIDHWAAEVQSIALSLEGVRLFIYRLEKEVEALIHETAGEELTVDINSIAHSAWRKLTLRELSQLMKYYALQTSDSLAKLNKEKYRGDIYKIKHYINKHYHENLTLKEIANEFFMNPVYLGQLFKKTYGIYFKDYLLQVRIEKAKKVLRQSDMRIYEVAEKVGFGSPDYFVTQFEKKVGLTPSKYRQRMNE